jgi:Flp pilus assembly protein TadD
MKPNRLRARFLTPAAMAALLALPVAGCKTTQTAEATGSLNAPVASSASASRSESDWRRDVETWGERYRKEPRNATAAIAYAQALRATDQRAQAVAVLEQASLQSPKDTALLGAYGRALADTGKYVQALDVLNRAHTPDNPDWRILSAQGAVLDQMGKHDEAQRYYASALKIIPDEASVLSNLGLSYALSKNLPQAETTLRRAAERPDAAPKVRQNLALVVGLQGRFAEAETIARGDLSSDEAAANVTYLRRMLAQSEMKNAPRPAAARRLSSGPS